MLPNFCLLGLHSDNEDVCVSVLFALVSVNDVDLILELADKRKGIQCYQSIWICLQTAKFCLTNKSN